MSQTYSWNEGKSEEEKDREKKKCSKGDSAKDEEEEEGEGGKKMHKSFLNHVSRTLGGFGIGKAVSGYVKQNPFPSANLGEKTQIEVLAVSAKRVYVCV